MNEPELARGPRTQSGKDASERLRSRVAIARAIIEARLERKWTQSELAESAGTKQSRISELESIRGNPTLETVDRVAHVLGLELSLKPAAATETQPYLAKQGSFNTIFLDRRFGLTQAFQCEVDPFEVNTIPPPIAEGLQHSAKTPRFA